MRLATKGKSRGSKGGANAFQLERVPLPEQKQRRRSKHRSLTQEVLRQLQVLRENWALKIALLGIPAKTLRSAVFRAASEQGIEITSASDPDHLYVWRKSPAPRPRG
jgi:hypothetical protein